jgi:hypothetical protein
VIEKTRDTIAVFGFKCIIEVNKIDAQSAGKAFANGGFSRSHISYYKYPHE